LLSHLVEGVQASMLVRLPAPLGANNNAWNEWTKTQARSRPFLWVNHLKAISTGYLDRGQSMVMTSPTGSGKTTLSILKIAATLCAGESVVYLAPTHALVDQVEADLSGHIGDIEPVSVEDTALEELGEKLPLFSVMTPERCLALLGFSPDLFAKVGLMVFDEFHLIGADDPSRTHKINARAIDAMLALILKTLKTLVSMWCGGQSLVEIEEWLLVFVQKHEGQVSRKASRSTTAQRARRFAIRITPDLGFLCGVLGQVANHLSEEADAPKRPVIEMLPQMIRAGDHTRHHAILRQLQAVSSRVKTYKRCEQLRSNFSAGPQSSIEEIRHDVTLATLVEAFTDFGKGDDA